MHILFLGLNHRMLTRRSIAPAIRSIAPAFAVSSRPIHGHPWGASDGGINWAPMPRPEWHATTILCVRKGKDVVLIGDGQVSMGATVVKPNARKVRRIGNGKVMAGFAGATADAFSLVERLEAKLEEYPGQLLRAGVETAKLWRTDKYLRHLEAMLIASDEEVSLCISGNGDVIESHDGLLAIGSGGTFALAAARALMDVEGMDAMTIATKVRLLSLAPRALLCCLTPFHTSCSGLVSGSHASPHILSTGNENCGGNLRLHERSIRN